MKTTTLLQQLKTDVQNVIASVENKFSSLPDDQLNFKATAERWSILECFEHLNLYNQYYLQAAETALQKVGSSKKEEMNYTWIGKKSVAMMHPSNTKKQKTFKKMIPSKSKLTGDVLATFLNDQQRLIRVISQANSLDVVKPIVPVEFFKLLKMNLAETIEFIVVHEQRHLAQAENILTQLRTSPQPILSI